jgi:hypothetical protein
MNGSRATKILKYVHVVNLKYGGNQGKTEWDLKMEIKHPSTKFDNNLKKRINRDAI